MAKTVEFTVQSSKQFTSYLKKFSSINNTVLFEADFEQSQFISKSANEVRSIVKYGVLSFSEANFVTDAKLKLRIKIGLYNISRLIKIIDQFGDNFKFIIKYDEIIVPGGPPDYAAISILIKNSDLKFSNECTSLNIFNYISDDKYTNIIKKVDKVVSFEFTKENIEKVRSLCELDKENKFIKFVNKDSNLYAKGKSFEYLIAVSSINEESGIAFYKDQFDKIDVENSNVIMGLDRMLFSSTDTITETVLSKVEGLSAIEDNIDEAI